MKSNKTISVIGLGYIGLPTALMLAAHGSKVIGVDIDRKRIEMLQSGKLPFTEDGLDALFETAMQNITFTEKHVHADMYILTVATPFDTLTKRIDTQYLMQASYDVLKVCHKDDIIIIESTVSPGTIEKFVRPVFSDACIHLVHAPERIMPGQLVSELVSNARTIGADNTIIAQRVKELYETFSKGEFVLTDIRTAEMTKLVENTFRDINIAYANELVKICNASGMNVHDVIRIANMHPRVNILNPGPGVGGHCIPIDPWFFVGDYPTLANLIRTARNVNDSMPRFVLERIMQIADSKGITVMSKIGFYGLTYKEDVDDIRESPTLQLLEEMHKHMADQPRVYDPLVKQQIVINQVFSMNDFLVGLEMIVVMIAHNEILTCKESLSGKVILDTRNALGLEGTFLL